VSELSKKKARFLFWKQANDSFFVFQAQLEGNMEARASMNPTFKILIERNCKQNERSFFCFSSAA
jgi:hypothetical protein